jgi:hypothetical protein
VLYGFAVIWRTQNQWIHRGDKIRRTMQEIVEYADSSTSRSLRVSRSSLRFAREGESKGRKQPRELEVCVSSDSSLTWDFYPQPKSSSRAMIRLTFSSTSWEIKNFLVNSVDNSMLTPSEKKEVNISELDCIPRSRWPFPR